MEIVTFKVPKVCRKCHKSSYTGHNFNDTQQIGHGTRVWEVWLCEACLAPVLTKKGD